MQNNNTHLNVRMIHVPMRKSKRSQSKKKWKCKKKQEYVRQKNHTTQEK